MRPHDMVGLYRLDIGDSALNKLGLRDDEMETCHDRMDLVHYGDFLRMLDRVDDSAMRAPGKDHQAFSLYVEDDSLLTRKRVEFDLVPALYLLSRRHFFIA